MPLDHHTVISLSTFLTLSALNTYKCSKLSMKWVEIMKWEMEIRLLYWNKPADHVFTSLQAKPKVASGAELWQHMHAHVLNSLLYLIYPPPPHHPNIISDYSQQFKFLELRLGHASPPPAEHDKTSRSFIVHRHLCLFYILDHIHIAFFLYRHTVHFRGFRASKLWTVCGCV